MYIERALAAREDEEENWWQEIETFAYCLDGKAPEDWQELLQRVAAEPAPKLDDSLESFKRYAVHHLIQVFAIGPCSWAETDADCEARLKRAIAAARRGKLRVMGEAEEEAAQRKEKAKLEALKEFARGPASFVITPPEDELPF
jgi:hypothetical protein